MIEMAIRFVLGNLTSLLFAGALVAAIFAKRPPSYGTRLLNWLLLLSVGVGGLWSGIFHVFFPEIASRSIGWQPAGPSPDSAGRRHLHRSDHSA